MTQMIQGMFANRHGGTALFCFLFLSVSFLTRVVLLIASHASIDWNPLSLLGVFLCGFFFDLASASYWAIPVVIYSTLLPRKIFMTRFHRRAAMVFFFFVLYFLLFCGAVEWFFWKEYGARFNFIAVDYLVYTTEVLGNIRESFPLPLIFGGLFLMTGMVFFLLHRSGCFEVWLQSNTAWKDRVIRGAGILSLPLIFNFAVNNQMVPAFENSYNRELARNGLYSFFAAFRNNELSYPAFYETEDNRQAFLNLREHLETENGTFLSQDPFNITRMIGNPGEEKRCNVIQITVESLSADFLGVFGNKAKLTPNLDDIADGGILFTNFYATGTRTDRAIEALTLSLPPTPGRSIVKRPHNEDLFSLGSVFKSRGYDTVFLYGGYGYFDNMTYFFENNGYRVVDRGKAPKEAITFTNAWGAADEDLYEWVLHEADGAYQEGKPFYHFVMTTSNHRPYTYPEGRIDIPSGTGRRGAVKYTDHAIGEFLRKAKERPWYANTVFVIVADHCANSAGKTDLPIKNYKVPLIIYSPALFSPRRVGMLCSQIDFGPTLLGLMQWSYRSRFYGMDVFRMAKRDERAFIGSYQLLGYMDGDTLAVLEPMRKDAVYRYDPKTGAVTHLPHDEALVARSIDYFQTAGYLFENRLDSTRDDR